MLLDFNVSVYKCKGGAEVLKINFNKSDMRISKSGRVQIDVWGNKLKQLKQLLVNDKYI